MLNKSVRRIIGAGLLCLLAMSCGFPAARAGLTLEINVIRYHQYGYYFYPGLTTNSAAPSVPFGDYFITSSGYPTNGSSGLYHFDTNGFNQSGGGSSGYGDFDGMMHELTNSTWSIFVTNSATTNVYYFTVTANISSNDLPYVPITFPADGTVNITNQPTFTWQGPTNYNNLVVYESDNSYSWLLSVTQTSWLSARVLYQGKNTFAPHYNSNSTTAVVSSVPTNGSGPISSWVSTAHLEDYSTSQFTVGTADPSGTSHTLVAHYAWDGTNGDGTASGVDTSGNGYDMNFGGSFGGQGGANSTTNTAAGPRAIQFHDGDGNSAGYVGWNPTPPSLLAALAGSFSVSCWIKTTQNNSGWDQAPAYYGAGIVSADNGGLANDVIPIALTGNKIGFNTGGDVEDVTLNSTASVNDGIYHHIVVTRNQLTGQKLIYIDGVLDSFSSGTTNRLNNPLLLTIGALSDARDADASSAYYFNGYDGELDDVQIYSGVLSAGEVASLHASPGSTVANGGGSSSGHTNVAHYAFNNSGNLGEDSSGNGNDAPGVSWWGPQHQFDTNAEAGGGAVQFFGTSYLNPYDQPLTNLNAVLAGSFTFSAWVKTTVTNGADDNNAFYGAVIFWAYNDQGNTNDTIPLAITGSKAAFTTRDHLGNFDTLHSISSVNDGNYHLITVTRDQGSGVKKIYVDGNFETLDIGTTDPLNGNNYNLTIGGYAYLIDSLNTNYSSYKGLLDDVQIYSGVLSASEVAYLYANPGATVANAGDAIGGHTNVAYYAFEDNTVFTADLSGHGNGISYAAGYGGGGCYTTNVPAAGNYAIFFFNNGGAGGSWLGANTNLLSTLAGSFSVSLWLKTTQISGNDTDDGTYNNAGIVSALTGSSTNFVIPMSLTGGKLAFVTGGGTQDTLHSAASINTGQYVHLVVTRDQGTGQKKIYVNGVLNAVDIAGSDLLYGSTDLAIGAQNFNAFDGEMDEIQIYSGVLAASEVAYLYNHPGTNVADGVTTTGQDFNAALNTTNLTWTTSGNTSWFVETTNTHDNVSAARSGAITNDTQTSYLETTVTGPGTLSFWWQSAADDFNYEIQFKIDGNYTNNIYGNTSWTQQTYFIGPGQHTLSWVALAYNSIPDTDAGYLDDVSFVVTTAPVITLNPFNQTNYPGYNVALLAAATSANTNDTITWQWFKVGSASPIANATSALFIPTNSGTAGVQGSYYGVASTAAGSANTTTASVSFVSAPLPPDWSRAFKSPFSPVDDSQITQDYYYGCFVDTNGNIYVAAQFSGNTMVGSSNLNSGTGGAGAAVVKQSPTGSPLWAVGITNNGSGHASAYGVASAPGGGAYLAGSFGGTNWLGTNQLTDAGAGDMFLARFDANGSNLWVRTFGGTNTDFLILNTLASDPAGNVTLAGLLGAGPVTIGTSNYNVVGQEGVLIQCDQTGAVRWSQLLPSEFPQYLTYNSGRLYVSVNTTTSGGTTNVVVGGVSNLTDRTWAMACLNGTNGQAIWVRGVGTLSGSSEGNPYAGGVIDDVPRLAVSGTNVFLTGVAYDASATFGAITVNFGSLRGQYFARYDTNGNAQVATTYGSVTTTPIAAVADANGNVYVSGSFDTYSIFGNNVIVAPVATRPYVGEFSQAFLAKFDRNGNPLWARDAIASTYGTVNFMGIALAADGVWASGWGLSGYYPEIVPIVFGTNKVNSSARYVYGGTGGSENIIWYPAGVLAKITDSAAVALPVTLLNPQDNGTNFQFSFLSQSGFTHAVQYRTNLVAGSNWQTYSNVTGDGALKTIPIPLSIFNPAKQGFVRVSTQ